MSEAKALSGGDRDRQTETETETQREAKILSLFRRPPAPGKGNTSYIIISQLTFITCMQWSKQHTQRKTYRDRATEGLGLGKRERERDLLPKNS